MLRCLYRWWAVGDDDARVVADEGFCQFREPSSVTLGQPRRMLFPSISPSAANASRNAFAFGSLFAAVLTLKTPTSGGRVASCTNARIAAHSARRRPTGCSGRDADF